VTSYNVEGRTPAEIAALLRELRDDEDKHLRMCEAAAARFREVVNFDAEADQIRRLLEGVLMSGRDEIGAWSSGVDPARSVSRSDQVSSAMRRARSSRSA
jgi:hypothetical protein